MRKFCVVFDLVYANRARIFKLLKNLGIDFTESVLCEKSIPLWN